MRGRGRRAEAAAAAADSPDVSERVAFGELVRVALPEHVSDAAAGENLQAASAHPHAEGQLWGRGGGDGGVQANTGSFLKIQSHLGNVSKIPRGFFRKREATEEMR